MKRQRNDNKVDEVVHMEMPKLYGQGPHEESIVPHEPTNYAEMVDD